MARGEGLPATAGGVPWSPTLWQGAPLAAWLRLLRDHRFAISPQRLTLALVDSALSLAGSAAGLLQEARYGRRIRRTRLEPPLFILGHWRSGTTFLHDLLALDPRFGYPTTYQCFCPAHFLVTERWFANRTMFLLPATRPMDGVTVGMDRPQEDEIALALLTGDASPYLDWAFPDDAPGYDRYLDLADLSPAELRRWQQTLHRFLQAVTVRRRKRLVLKSPAHTARVPVLRAMFPGAQFVHIVRDPRAVIPSTLKLHRAMALAQGLQAAPTFDGLERRVFATYERLFARLDEARPRMEPGRFHELRYEDLVRDPAGELRRLHDCLALGGWDAYEPLLQSHLSAQATYQAAEYDLSERELAEIAQRCGSVIRRFGYDAA